MPAFTIVAEWRYALIGVGATIAPGSQKWNGNWADLASAPRATRPTATSAWVPESSEPRIADSDHDPVSCASRTKPASIARPAALVVMSARSAAVRARSTSSSMPISR